MADKAIEYSKTIYSGCDKDDIEVLILQRFIKKLKEDMAEAERTIGEMIKLAQELPDFSIIKSIPGIGDNLAAKFVPMIDYMVVSINTQQMKVICRIITKNFYGTKTVL